MYCWIGVLSLGFRAQGSGFSVQVIRFKVYEFRVEGSGFRVQGLEFKVLEYHILFLLFKTLLYIWVSGP